MGKRVKAGIFKTESIYMNVAKLGIGLARKG
jgi:hypothetical protein